VQRLARFDPLLAKEFPQLTEIQQVELLKQD
jgi:hypothetical protein